MQVLKLSRNSEIEIFPANPRRALFSVRVLTFGVTVVIKTNQEIPIPGNDATYRIESALPWTGAIVAVCNEEAEIEVDETV